MIADKVLYKMGLWNELCKIGMPHIIGSYKMDMMAWNDLDIDIENSEMSLDKLYDLTKFIINTFHPKWYEAKEEVNDEKKIVWFHGFEMMIDGELWNFDLWFFDKETILKAEEYCENIMKKINEKPGSKDCIIQIKQDLIKRNLYNCNPYSSMDVYKTVLDHGITNVDQFIEHYSKSKNTI